MLDFISSKLQNSLSNIKKKTTLKEEDILQVVRDIRLSLLEADVNLMVVKEFISKVKEEALGQDLINKLNSGQQFVKIVHEELVNILGNKSREVVISKKPFVFMMTGLQGSGKTTTVAKLALYFRKKQKINKILLVAGDIYRPAAIDQLETLAKQLGIDIYFDKVTKSAEDIVEKALIKAKSENYELVLIDTAGRLSIDEKLMEELQNIKKIAKPDEILFVADAMSGQDIINVAKTFHEKLKLTGSIITKLDSNARGGAALSIRYLLKLPILFIGTGEKISSLDLFYPDRMADRILGMGDVLSLIEKASEVIDEKKSKKMMNKILSGKFDLDDLMDNLRQVKKMGSLSKILKMLPQKFRLDTSKTEQAEEKLKIYEYLINSMTKAERKNPKLLKNASRKQRVLKGSGRSAQEFNKLINDFDSMKKTMKDMSSKNNGKPSLSNLKDMLG